MVDLYTLTVMDPPCACDTPHHCSASASPTASIEESLCTRWTPPDSTATLHCLFHHGVQLSAAGTDLHAESCKDSSWSPFTSSIQCHTAQLEQSHLTRHMLNHSLVATIFATTIDLCYNSANKDINVKAAHSGSHLLEGCPRRSCTSERAAPRPSVPRPSQLHPCCSY